jgi:hypothetical protein
MHSEARVTPGVVKSELEDFTSAAAVYSSVHAAFGSHFHNGGYPSFLPSTFSVTFLGVA